MSSKGVPYFPVVQGLVNSYTGPLRTVQSLGNEIQKHYRGKVYSMSNIEDRHSSDEGLFLREGRVLS